jgi:hypothetical protein
VLEWLRSAGLQDARLDPDVAAVRRQVPAR